MGKFGQNSRILMETSQELENFGQIYFLYEKSVGEDENWPNSKFGAKITSYGPILWKCGQNFQILMETSREVENFGLSYLLCEKSISEDQNYSSSKSGTKMTSCRTESCKNHIYPGRTADGLTNWLTRDIESRYGCGETFILSVTWLKIHPLVACLDIQNPLGV